MHTASNVKILHKTSSRIKKTMRLEDYFIRHVLEIILGGGGQILYARGSSFTQVVMVPTAALSVCVVFFALPQTAGVAVQTMALEGVPKLGTAGVQTVFISRNFERSGKEFILQRQWHSSMLFTATQIC